MNYYKRHLGDYAKDTRHLSLAEHGAFCLLLDYYYATEKPIPDDRCERIANAYADSEREAVRSVLKSFFELTPDGWRNARADAEIATFHGKSLKAKASAESRWVKSQCERNANASETQCDGNAIHKPLAISHKELEAGGERIPLDDGTEFAVTDDLLAEYRTAYPRVDVLAEVRKARAWCVSNPANRKTRKGLPRFLNSWLSRASLALPPESKAAQPGGGRRAL